MRQTFPKWTQNPVQNRSENSDHAVKQETFTTTQLEKFFFFNAKTAIMLISGWAFTGAVHKLLSHLSVLVNLP